MKKLQTGYTLVELSISLTIISLLIAGGLGIVSKISDAKRYKITEERIHIIEEALDAFVKTNLFLPCPAMGNSLETSPDFGISALYDTSTHSCADSLTDETGMIPVRTLDIPDITAYDGWGRKFTYRLATGLGESSDFRNPVYIGDLRISDLAGNEKTTIDRQPPGNMGAAYVIISGGANGNATHSNIALLDPNAPNRAEENKDHGANRLYIQNERTFDFSDVVAFKQKRAFEPVALGKSPITIPSYVCSNAKLLTTGDTLDDLETEDSNLATQVAVAAEAVESLCYNLPDACSITPEKIENDALQVWLDANDPNNTGTTPSSWSAPWIDKSGTAHDATASSYETSPRYLLNILNEKPVMRFKGEVFFSINIQFLKNTSYTIFMVYTKYDDTIPTYLLGGEPDFKYGYGESSTEFQLIQSSTDTLSITSPPILRDVPVLSTAVLNSGLGKAIRLFQEGTIYSSGFDGNSASISNINADGFIGKGPGSGSSNGGFIGDIAEIIIYNTALSTNERAAIEGYLYRKWFSGECP